jgi:hypothetical protein
VLKHLIQKLQHHFDFEHFLLGLDEKTRFFHIQTWVFGTLHVVQLRGKRGLPCLHTVLFLFFYSMISSIFDILDCFTPV